MYMTIIFKHLFPDDLETGHGSSGTQGLLYKFKVHINDNSGLTLTYITGSSNLVKIAHCASDKVR